MRVYEDEVEAMTRGEGKGEVEMSRIGMIYDVVELIHNVAELI